jgi:hypothetical protein
MTTLSNRAVRRVVALAIGLHLALTPIAPATPVEPARSAAQQLQAPDPLRSYRGLATWVDMFDASPWEDPEAAVARMAEQGVTTIFLETSNYKRPNAIFKPKKTGRFLAAAHAAGMAVIAWYVPGFDDLERDERRALKAINHVAESGETFDGFALDIEATVVEDIDQRNRRAIKLSKALRAAVDEDYVLGAIIPDVRSTYWPRFPYVKLDALYDVFLPMTYWTHRFADGPDEVRAYINEQLAHLRSATGDEAVAMHVIGGIAGTTTKREVRAYAKALIAGGALGGSLYDFAITEANEWAELQRLRALATP